MNLYIFNENRRAAMFGVGTYIRELTMALQNSNSVINVVNLRQDNPQIQIDEIEGINYWSIPKPVFEKKKVDNNKQNELYSRNIVYLLQLHINDKTDLVFHLNNNQSRTLAEELKKAFDCRVIMTVHYFDWCLRLFGNVSRFRKLLTTQEADQEDKLEKTVKDLYCEEKEFFELVDHIICLSKNTQQILQKDYQINPEKTTVIYNGLTDSIQSSDKQRLRQKYHISDIPVILFAGRLDEIKGLTYLLRAFKIVLNKYPRCQLIIAGNGIFDIYMKECEDIWMNITWTGLISKDKLCDLYSIADIGVMPSLYESFGYVVVEMMLHNLPVITTVTSGLCEVVDNTCGIKIPVIEHPDSAEIDTGLLAEKMLYLLQHPEERERMGTNARKCYEIYFSGDIFRQSMLQLYESLNDHNY